MLYVVLWQDNAVIYKKKKTQGGKQQVELMTPTEYERLILNLLQ